MMKGFRLYVVIGCCVLAMGLFSSCADSSNQASTDTRTSASPEQAQLVETTSSTMEEAEPAAPILPLADQISAKGKAVLAAFEEEDMASLAKLVHPERGVTFSPMVYVSKEDRHFSSKDIAMMAENKQSYHWGKDDGSGKALQMTFKGYCERYVYDADFLGTDSVYIDRHFQRGNAINNARKAYEGCHMIEYYVPGVNPDYAGLDWRALRLVFEPFEETQYLTGVIHAEWTP